MKIYCSSCGKGIEYASTKPNFCVSCGEALTAQAVIKQRSSPPIEKKLEPGREEIEAAEDPEDEDSHIKSVDVVPDISQLDVDFLTTPKKETIKDLMGTSGPRGGDDDGFIRGETQEDQKNFWANFKKEAGQLRSKE